MTKLIRVLTFWNTISTPNKPEGILKYTSREHTGSVCLNFHSATAWRASEGEQRDILTVMENIRSGVFDFRKVLLGQY